jgi:hypothetical protein
MLVWTLNGPDRMPGQFFVAALGTAVVFSAGLALGYTGLMIYNPPTVKGVVAKKLIPLRVSFTPTGTATATGNCPLGLIKDVGTCTAGNFSGFSGIITSQGIEGTATGVAIIAGTASYLNGTAGPSLNGPNWIQMLGNVAGGTQAGASPVPVTGYSGIYDLMSEESVMPGESVAICTNQAVSGLCSIAWVEVPLNSGA